ncbi:hypothetical protein BT96DRAFT_822640 [Gymnopus androsaceus JB14]|uniref:Uncharacterized protein n=1 Tax=Gymnopus androsaceus JB14 TaxID=1447944 RepID=A0A6A4HGW0_9AGAR|nr:hypothetical protein BT96DRAFT_822640 [Gymnopus androsaceus JB14]
MRCPRLGIQTFVRALSDMQGIQFKNHILVQFSLAYDIYIQLVEAVRLCVQEKLDRVSLHWQILNNCPACQYEVVGEPVLAIWMMIAVDDNNLLKHLE